MDISLDLLFDIRVTSLIVAVLLSVILYWYSTKNHDYWRKRGIPCTKTYPFLGSFGDLLTKNMEDIEIERYRKLGRLYGYFEGSKPQITVADPELIRNILVKDFQNFVNRRTFQTGDPITDNMISVKKGEDWKQVRSIISPTFSTGKIKRIMGIFQECAKTVLQNLKIEKAKNASVDVLRLYGAFTMDVIASSAFSTKIDSHNDPENTFVKSARGAFNQGFSLKFILFFLMPKLMKLLGMDAFQNENTRFFQKVSLEIIAERKKTGQTRNDFLQLLMDTAEELKTEEKLEEKIGDIIENYGDDATNHSVFKGIKYKNLSQDEIVAQCVIFFLAGYHTTATTLGITTYLLALNQKEQEKLFQEIKEVLSETDGILTYEAVQKMKYLDNVISETLRLYSPGIRLEREAESDYKLGDTGITVPKGMIIGIPVYAMHHDSNFFPEPEKFDPERFSTEGREKQIPYTYLPFGAGPRNCVGMRFALMEIKVCLIYVFSVFNVQKSPETKVPLELAKGMGLISPKPIILRLEERNNCPLKQ